MKWFSKQLDRFLNGCMWGVGFTLCVVAMLILFGVIWCLLTDYFPNSMKYFVITLGGSAISPPTPQEMKMLMALISGGHVMPAADLLATIANFYNTIITVLVTLLTLFAAATFFYLRMYSSQQAHELVSKEVKNKLSDADFIEKHLRENKKIQSDLNSFVETATEQFELRVGKIEDVLTRIKSLESAVSVLASSIDGEATPVAQRRRQRGNE